MLLGLVAIHITFAIAIAQFFLVEKVTGKISCDNMAALNQASSKTRKRVSVGVKHSDLHRTIRTLKSLVRTTFRYVHVKAHQDTVRPWRELTLTEQLNVICDGLANRAIKGYLEQQSPMPRGTTLLPLEKAAVFIGTKKSASYSGLRRQGGFIPCRWWSS